LFDPRVSFHSLLSETIINRVILSPFAGQTFSFTVLGDTEPTDLMSMIETVLMSSGWVRVPSQIGDVETSGAGMIAGGVGVETQMPLRGDPKAWECAKILASALTAEGIVSSAKLSPALKNPQAINIMIGKKPQ
jgi:hypothetical protein